jgi:hypothetical protein
MIKSEYYFFTRQKLKFKEIVYTTGFVVLTGVPVNISCGFILILELWGIVLKATFVWHQVESQGVNNFIG